MEIINAFSHIHAIDHQDVAAYKSEEKSRRRQSLACKSPGCCGIIILFMRYMNTGKLESNKLYKLEQEKKKQRDELIREEGIWCSLIVVFAGLIMYVCIELLLRNKDLEAFKEMQLAMKQSTLQNLLLKAKWR